MSCPFVDFLNVSILESHRSLYFKLINSERDRMKKKILLLAFGLFFSCMESTSPFSVDPVCQKNPLTACENCNDWIENKLLELLDHVIAAKRYWLTVGDKPWYRVITRPIHHWYNFSWQTEIREHLSTLDDLQNTLAIKLSKHIAHEHESDISEETKEDIYRLITEANVILKMHGIPLHVMRNWIFYVGAAIATYKAVQLYQDYLKDRVVITFDKKDLITVRKACRDSGDNHNLMLSDSSLYITTSQSKIEKLQSMLDVHPIQPIEAARSATMQDLYRLILDENGQFIGKTFVKTCFITPVKNIWNKLQSSSTSQKTHLSEAEKEELLEKDAKPKAILVLNKAVSMLDENGERKFQNIVDEHKILGSFEKLPYKSVETLVDTIQLPVIEYAKKLALDEINKNGTYQTANHYVEKFDKWWNSKPKTDSNAPKQALEETLDYAYMDYFLTVLKIQYPYIKNNISTFVNALEFLTETAKMTPFFLTLYVGGRGVANANQWYRNSYFKEPLRYDLKDFINFLDENLYTYVNNPAFKGLHYYWTARLKRYKSFMDSKNRIYFEKDLQKLTRGSTINHEIETLRVILYNELEHF